MRIPAEGKVTTVVLTGDTSFRATVKELFSTFGDPCSFDSPHSKSITGTPYLIILDLAFPSMSLETLLKTLKNQNYSLVLVPKDVKDLERFPIDKLKVKSIISRENILSHLRRLLSVKNPVDARVMEDVSLNSTGTCLKITFADGTRYSLNHTLLECDDRTRIEHVVLIDKGYAFKVKQKSGNIYDVPWDTVHYFCNPAYEYYYKRKSPQPLISPPTIGQRIRTIRQRNHMTITEVALRAGLKRPNLSRIEGGKVRPSLLTMERIADALSVPVVDLIAKSL